MKNTLIEHEWITKENFKALVIYYENSHRCGYVGFDENHWVYQIDFNNLFEINVHGGLTFSGQLRSSNDNLWYLGYDCAHHMDKSAYNDGEERTLEYCILECEKVSEQIEKLSNTSCEYYIRSTKQELPEEIHNQMLALAINDDYYARKYVEDAKLKLPKNS